MSDTRLVNLSDTAVLNEDELLDRAREGDKSAFGALYLRHKDAARRVAGMCTNSSADAEDAVAEGFARVFAALPRMVGARSSSAPTSSPASATPPPTGSAASAGSTCARDARHARRLQPPTTSPCSASSGTWWARPSRPCPSAGGPSCG